DVGAEMRAFFAARGVEPAPVAAPDADGPLVDTGAEPDPPPDGDADAARQSTIQKIAGLSVAQKMTLAMKGSREERALLIRDPNKLVGLAVLSSPKITETEVESIAK